MNRRKTALWDKSSPAITPALRPAAGEMTRDELISQIFDLRRVVAAERIRHSKMENALTRYQEILERQITDQREAFRTLGKVLLPSEKK